MNQTDKAALKQFLFSLARIVLASIGTLIVSKGWATEKQAAVISSNETVEYVVGFVLIAVPVIWQWAKSKYNVEMISEARRAEPLTPIKDIQAKALAKRKVISSV